MTAEVLSRCGREQGQVERARDGRDFLLRAQQWLPASPQAVWSFVSDCRHMNHVIPPFVSFRILSTPPDQAPPALAPGVTYSYRLRLHRVGVFWRTRITEVDRPRRFVDVQEKGPYASFQHEHTFHPADGGTLTRDLVRYRPPGGPLAAAVDRLYVAPSLRRLFEHRHRRLAQLFADGGNPADLLVPRQDATPPEPAA